VSSDDQDFWHNLNFRVPNKLPKKIMNWGDSVLSLEIKEFLRNLWIGPEHWGPKFTHQVNVIHEFNIIDIDFRHIHKILWNSNWQSGKLTKQKCTHVLDFFRLASLTWLDRLRRFSSRRGFWCTPISRNWSCERTALTWEQGPTL